MGVAPPSAATLLNYRRAAARRLDRNLIFKVTLKMIRGYNKKHTLF